MLQMRALAHFFSPSGVIIGKALSPPYPCPCPARHRPPADGSRRPQPQRALRAAGSAYVEPVRVAGEARAGSRERGSHHNNDDVVLPALERVDRGRGAHPEELRKLWRSPAPGEEIDIRRIGRDDGDLDGLDARIDQVDGEIEGDLDLLRALL